jgi:DNA modification methylase
MSDIVWTNVRVRLGDLKPWADNPRLSTKAQARRLLASFDKFGQVQTVAIDPDCNVLDGHQRLSALLTIHGDRYELDARQASRALSDAERRELVVSLHAGAVGSWDWNAISGWNSEELQSWGMDGDLLKSWNNDANNLKELLKSEQAGGADAEPQTDRAAELLEVWGCKSGDLWTLGDNRLLIADCTIAENVSRLMDGEKARLVYTDPPYGVDYDGGTKVREKLAGDETTDLYEPACKMAAQFSDEKAALYLWHAGVKGIAAAAAAAAAGYEIRCEIVWNKNQAQFGALSAQYKQKHEPLYYCFKRGKAPYWFGPTNEVTVWDCDRASVNEYHPTQKPTELAERAMRNSSTEGDIILDLFLGSGATLIAGTNLKRRVFACEISEKYAAVILQRFADAFPALPIRRLDAGG